MKDTELVKFELESGALYAHVVGEIDHHSALTVRQAIDTKIFTVRPEVLYLELSRVGFMDSSGLGLIMGRYSLMKKLGGRTVVLEPSEAIMRIVRLAGLERTVKIEYAQNTKEGLK